MKRTPSLVIQLQGHDAPYLAAKEVLWACWEKLGQEVKGGARYAWNNNELVPPRPVG